ncbi:hypothetical protein N8I71_00955 [Roseibacterium sp. SDUM158016]|uniref:hypothetical protein n=1 Tax=Roseicyclus sediminis TaxID=2980997 RepID=UPI0021CF66B7|nr:hypothetical protein [Roseibacterium sp. SDUM158016]MCU4651385.1 hypothetical protein [Roseibacterium sp. SDUM158016]
MSRRTLTCAILALGLVAPGLGLAQSNEGQRLALELNRVDPVDGACRLTFLAENALGEEIAALSLETVLIDTSGVVERLTLFDFGALPMDVPRVRQFDVPGLACEALGRVLINGVSECGGVGNCAERLQLSTRTDVELLG